MEDTHRTVMDLAYAVEATQKQLKRPRSELRCELDEHAHHPALRIKRGRLAILRACLTPVVEDNDDMGWEEQVDAALAHLLRTSSPSLPRLVLSSNKAFICLATHRSSGDTSDSSRPPLERRGYPGGEPSGGEGKAV